MPSIQKHYFFVANIAPEFNGFGGASGDARDLLPGLVHSCGCVDTDHVLGAVGVRETRDHAGLRRTGHRAHDHVVESNAPFLLLVLHFECPTGKPVAAKWVVGGTGGNRIWLATCSLDLFDGTLPRIAETNVESSRVESNVSTENSRKQNVAGFLVLGFVVVDPMLLDDDCFQAQLGGHRGHLTGVVGLNTTDGYEGVAALRQGIGGQVLEFARLVPAVGDAGIQVLAFGPDLDVATQVFGEAIPAFEGRRAVQQGCAGEGFKGGSTHGCTLGDEKPLARP